LSGQGRGLTGVWNPFNTECAISGDGYLTVAGETLDVAVWVTNHGHVRNAGTLNLTTVLNVSAGTWFNFEMPSGAPTVFENTGTVTLRAQEFPNVGWIEQGITINSGVFELQANQQMHLLNFGNGGGDFTNRGEFRHAGLLTINLNASFLNACGSTFVDQGGIFSTGPDFKTPTSEVCDADGDGVPDESDAFPNSDRSALTRVGTSISSVPNQLLPTGGTFNDYLGTCYPAVTAAPAAKPKPASACVAAFTKTWADAGLITKAQKKELDGLAR
jgi:hypothetical protein